MSVRNEYALRFRNQLFTEKRIIFPVRLTPFHSEDYLPAEKAIGTVIQRTQIPIPETDEPHTQIPLLALPAFAL